MMEKPRFLIGQQVIFNGFLGYRGLGFIRAATFFDGSSYFERGWRYYISIKPNGLFVSPFGHYEWDIEAI